MTDAERSHDALARVAEVRQPPGRAGLILMIVLLGALAAPLWADMPAVNYDFVDREAMVAAAMPLGENRAAALRTALEMAGRGEQPRSGFDARFHFAGESGQVGGALLELILAALREGEREGVDAFIRAVNEQRLIRGLLRARDGGPYHTELALTEEAGKRLFVMRQVLADGRSVTFSRAFSLCVYPERYEIRTTANGSRLVELTRHDHGGLRSEAALICVEADGAWLADGPTAEWDASATKRVEGQYRQGKRDGPWQFRDDQGRLRARIRYGADEVLEKTEILWNKDGTKWREETRRQENGGEVRELVEWDYHANRQTRSEKRHQDGYRHGLWTLWDENGQVLDRTEFRRGVAIPPIPGDSAQDRRAYALFMSAAEARQFDRDRLAALADGLDDAGEQALASVVFAALRRSDDNHPEVFERLYRTVIEFAPGTDLAHHAYWRLANLYRQAYDRPRLEDLAGLMEQFLTRYRTSSVVAMAKYPDVILVFSPLRTLHQAYEELGRFGPIAAYYDVRVREGAAMKAEDCWDYAQALDKLKRSRDAILWYKKYLARHPERDFSNELARQRLNELE